MANCKVDNFSKEELRSIVEESFCMAEVLVKLGYTTTSGRNNDTVKSRLEKYSISTSHFNYQSPVERNESNVFCQNSTATQATLRRWYARKFPESEAKCSICFLPPFWNNKPLTFTLDHVNGNNRDNRLENLRWICPNCDRQLDTFAGKNLPKKEKLFNLCLKCGVQISSAASKCSKCHGEDKRVTERPSREELKDLIRNFPMTAVGKKFGVSDNAIRKWCEAYELPHRKKDIQAYSDIEWSAL